MIGDFPPVSFPPTWAPVDPSWAPMAPPPMEPVPFVMSWPAPHGWTKVTVLAEPGTEFGVVSDVNGELTLTSRRKGEGWPCGRRPIPSSVKVVSDTFSFVVTWGGL
jgi:hypothetical protein